jgi:hypothetical protein
VSGLTAASNHPPGIDVKMKPHAFDSQACHPFLLLVMPTYFQKVFGLITPLVLLSLAGVIMIGYGFVNMGQENNVLQFFFGVPLAAGSFGLHALVRQACRRNVLTVWIAELVLVALMWYGFNKS